MSNRLFQGIIHQMKESVGRTIGVIDENGIVVACSELTKIGESRQNVRELVRFASNSVTSDNYTYRVVGASSRNDCIVFVEGTDAVAEKLRGVRALRHLLLAAVNEVLELGEELEGGGVG